MCFFKKKKKIEIETKYKVGDPVRFRYRGELCYGWIYVVFPKAEGQTIYNVQVGGQCPAIIEGLKEEELTLR